MKKNDIDLLKKMELKIQESEHYLRVRLFLCFIWFFEFFYIQLGYGKYDFYYWSILIVCLICWFHMAIKNKKCLDEYELLKKEYENNI